jgi:hypothetical protein
MMPLITYLQVQTQVVNVKTDLALRVLLPSDSLRGLAQGAEGITVSVGSLYLSH